MGNVVQIQSTGRPKTPYVRRWVGAGESITLPHGHVMRVFFDINHIGYSARVIVDGPKGTFQGVFRKGCRLGLNSLCGLRASLMAVDFDLTTKRPQRALFEFSDMRQTKAV